MSHAEVRKMVRKAINEWIKESSSKPPKDFFDFSRRISDSLEISCATPNMRKAIYESNFLYDSWRDIEAEMSQGREIEKIEIWNSLIEHHMISFLQTCNLVTSTIESTDHFIKRLKL